MKHIYIMALVLILISLTSCKDDVVSRPMSMPELTLVMEQTHTPLPSIQRLASPTPIPSKAFTETPLSTSTSYPTVDLTTPTSAFTVVREFTFTPTPNYYAEIKGLYQLLVGDWWGKMRVTVNRQGRKVRYIVVAFYNTCEMGQVCGRYHVDDGCFGELMLSNWRPTFLVFRNLEYSGKDSCPNLVAMNVRALKNERLSLTFSYRNENNFRVNKSVTLFRK